ncbi:DUF167 family protein [uncultured Phenylobacterium sp.]|uniref:DUF167 family protein n=1 Tax=uncultured Phenylobacterium sp. TaxID=349273 RepID=UPI0025FBE356|nr:DUF167 family protein [uncultured Phenylobacterium sp.]
MAVQPAPPAHRLTVRVTPRGGRDAIEGWTADAQGRPLLKLRVATAAADGSANSAVVALVARALRIPRSAVRIASGATARVKRLELDGVGPADLARAFGSG